jgi:phosphoribosylformylglycinamidine (FGAM) synthase-like enzyme
LIRAAVVLAAAAEMAVAGGLGAGVELDAVPADMNPSLALRPLALAFTETPGRFLCAVPAAAADRFAAVMEGVPWAWIGGVHAEPVLTITAGGSTAALPLARLARAWRGERTAD